MQSENANYFYKNGLLLFIAFYAAQYVFYELFYTYTNPYLWAGKIPHKYIAAFNVLLFAALYIIITKNKQLFEQIYYRFGIFPEFSNYFLWAGTATVFCHGTYIIQNILLAKIRGYDQIDEFIYNNLYVQSAADPFALLNTVILNPLIFFPSFCS